MEMRHYPVRLAGSERAFALLAPTRPETAAIFVHGFGGSPDRTWVDFQHLIDELGPQRSIWNRWDLYFYSYRSQNQIAPLAQEFVKFLKTVAARHERLIVDAEFSFPSSTTKYGIPLGLLDVRGTESYTRLFLVGHSTGAVIIRQAIWDIVREIGASAGAPAESQSIAGDDDPAERLIMNAYLRLFAPAHLGVLGAGLLGFARSLPITDRIVNAWIRTNPLYQNAARGSPILTNLQAATERLYSSHKIPALKAYSLFGENEDVVFTGGYSHDARIRIERAQHHTSICKPTMSYTVPLEFVTHEPAIAKRA